MEVSQLRPQVMHVLTAPNVDLARISAKSVRRQLMENNPELDAEWIKEHKAAIDELIGAVFDQVNALTADSSAPASTPGKRKRSSSPGSVTSQPRPAPAKKPTKREISDEEYARQLSNQLNSRPTRGSSAGLGGKSAPTPKRGGAGKKSKKSKAEIVDSDGEADQNEKNGAKKKKRTGGGGLMKEYVLSNSLATFTGVTTLSRPQVVKRLWDHIKANQLQDPQDKRVILCDDMMKTIFNTERLNMFTMNKLIGDHLFSPEEV